MIKSKILNPALMGALTRIGHTDSLVIADPGLPLPGGTQVIDLALISGIPSFLQVLNAIMEEFVAESYITATEMQQASNPLYNEVQARMGGLPQKQVSHSELKELTKNAKVIIRTGETTPYANIILVGGVNF